MRGFPRSFNTKSDVLNALTMDKEQTVVKLQELLDNRFIWVIKSELKSEKKGVNDDTHKLVIEQDEEGNNKFIQMELVEDEFAEIFRLGFTVKEVEKIIKGAE